VSKQDTVLIWDVDRSPPEKSFYTIVLWRSYTKAYSSNTVSIPHLVEKNSDSLRARYLDWVYKLGEQIYKGSRIIDHLEIRVNFSYWWMTLLVEKCNYCKSPNIENIIRIFAFDQWTGKKPLKKLIYTGSNAEIVRVIKLWCKYKKVKFIWDKDKKKVDKGVMRNIYRSLPLVFQALIWFTHHIWSYRFFIGTDTSIWKESTADITFVTYSANIDAEKLKSGIFQSAYWGEMPDLLHKKGKACNWIHIYSPDDVLNTPVFAAQVINDFNLNTDSNDTHILLYSFISRKVIFKTLFDWWKIIWKGVGLGGALKKVKSKQVAPWLLAKRDWRDSIFGPTAIKNLLFLNLFDAAFGSMRQQSKGVYLQENQGWEFACISSWKLSGHQKLIGCPHSTVRYWDLRYFFDPRTFYNNKSCAIPLPDKVAINGKASYRMYKDGGYPIGDLVNVEALRYQYLLNNNKVNSRRDNKILTILVLGDYLHSNTAQQMSLLNGAIQDIGVKIRLIVKPHPMCMIKKAEYPNLKMEIVTNPLSCLLHNCDIAYTSSSTSAAVDAYCFGLNVITVSDPSSLNFSPLLNEDGVVYISTVEELKAEFLSYSQITDQKLISKNFFYLDQSLEKWNKLLLKG
jgi:surface carbohydrate biosynthesis protein (TIGR04326 family)